ncbi:MAG: 3-isopropylmalate dehydratase small subunit [Betaproteobacteria bacterium]|nr:MAG: 3-isopropylmalate dehydratase small subunit [Betaproteobacteria bacterium]
MGAAMTQATGRVWKLGADIDTDALAPGRWMKLALPELATHCLEAVRPEFAREVRAGDVIAAGPNFGVGSSREQAAAALKHLGIAAVLAPSFAGIFYRNAINLGLPVLVCARAGELADGERIALDLRQGIVARADGGTLACEPLPRFLWDIVAAGGLLPSLRQRFASKGVKA